MDLKRINIIWATSLIIIFVATIILVGTNIIVGIDLPDILVRVLGVIDLVLLPIFAFSTIKKFKSRK